MDSIIKPTVPMMANTMLKPENTFSPTVVLGTRRPLCRNHQSEAKERSRKMVVMTQPAMKSGFISCAPMLLMKGIVAYGLIDGYRFPCSSTAHSRSRPSRVASHTTPEMMGRT
jgi:hypothetical protein